jgi:hypothetical protein
VIPSRQADCGAFRRVITKEYAVRLQLQNAAPWVVAGLVALAAIAYHHQFVGPPAPRASIPDTHGPARDLPLAGGGISDGSECGTKGYHYLPVRSVTDTGGRLPGTPTGPAAVLGAYGTEISGAADPGHFTINLLIGTGSGSRTLDLTAPLGTSGVAVEIEGPNGLVGGAHDLPAALDDPTARLPNGKIHVDAHDGLSVEVAMPAAALCPGYHVMNVGRKLGAPVDSHSTITGQPPYTITVSISDPAITTLRSELNSTATGPVLAANNRVASLAT